MGGWHPAPALRWPPPTLTLAWGSSGWGAGRSWEGTSSAWGGGGVPEACHLADLLPGPAGTTSSGPCTDPRPHFVLREMGSQSDASGAWYPVSTKQSPALEGLGRPCTPGCINRVSTTANVSSFPPALWRSALMDILHSSGISPPQRLVPSGSRTGAATQEPPRVWEQVAETFACVG